MSYAGFWRRFGAFWLDFVVLLPLTGTALWGNQQYRLFDVYYFVPRTLFGLFYSVHLVRRFGGTPGKLLAGLRIRKPDGAHIGYREAILRYLPEALLSTTMSVGFIWATLALTDSEYLSLSYLERSKQLTALAPSWYQPLSIILQIWIWSEFVVMMTNRKRRALHDFIAGTVVVIDAPSQPFAPAGSPERRAGAPGVAPMLHRRSVS